jgi:hypothetical protein
MFLVIWYLLQTMRSPDLDFIRDPGPIEFLANGYLKAFLPNMAAEKSEKDDTQTADYGRLEPTGT